MPARSAAVLALLASCAALGPAARAQDAHDAEADRMQRVIQDMQRVKNRATQQAAGAYGRAVAPIERSEPKPPEAEPSWPMRHKWKLAGALAVLLLGIGFVRMERAWRRR